MCVPFWGRGLGHSSPLSTAALGVSGKDLLEASWVFLPRELWFLSVVARLMLRSEAVGPAWL